MPRPSAASVSLSRAATHDSESTHCRTKENPRQGSTVEVTWRFKFLRSRSVAAGKCPLRAEHHRDDTLVLGGVEAGRTGADALRQGDLRSIERCHVPRVEHVDREPE